MPKAYVNNIQIEYETFGKHSQPKVLLIYGLSGQLIHWPAKFCIKLADHGFHVIRFDNRDTGLSTKFDELGANEAMEIKNALVRGEEIPVPYSIEDMANDALGLLDFLNIEKAHICGMSMGGFIAQTLAVNHAFRLLSLTSIYSHTGKKRAFPPDRKVAEFMMALTPEKKNAYIEHMLKFLKMIFGTGLAFNKKFHLNLIAQSYDRCFCPEGVVRQNLAIMTQKDRTQELKKLKIPTLVIHGDEDPLIPIAGGKATADAIPDAKLKIINGMGHEVPNLDAYWSDILDEMISHMDKIDKGKL